MTNDRHFDRDLPGLLTDLAAPSMPSYRDDIVRRTALSRQRPAWMFSERWIPMDTTLQRVPVGPANMRRLALLGLLVMAAVAAVIVATGGAKKPPLPPYGPAANGMMVYEAGGDILLADPKTGESRAITNGDDLDSDPRFSPDGRLIAFVRYRPDGYAGWLANADGTNVHPMPGAPCHGCTGWGWMGDSRKIFVTSTAVGRDITITDTATGDQTLFDVPGDVGLVAGRPPDDQQIAYITGSEGPGYAIYSMNRDGTGKEKLVSAAGIGWFQYSPNGSQIAYEAYDDSYAEWKVRVVDSDGRNDRLLETSEVVQHQGMPKWSPDGRALLVWRTYMGSPPILAILRPDGTLVRDIAEIRVAGAWGFSPDGSSIIYVPADSDAREAGRCPLGDLTTCPAVLVGVDKDSITRLPFKPVSLSMQRLAP